MPKHSQILLFRSPEQNADGVDKYEKAISAKLSSINPDYECIVNSLPVLTTITTNIDQLASLDARGISAVIFTSARACEAWKAAFVNSSQSYFLSLLAAIDLNASFSDFIDTWIEAGCLFYAVGKSTSAALRSTPGHCNLDFRGDSSGTAEKLGQFILHDEELKSKGDKKVLYLTGDKNRDTLPAMLRDGGMKLHELQVYETGYDESFEPKLQRVLESMSTNSVAVLAFFAPSSTKMALPLLKRSLTLPTLDHTDSPQGSAIVLAIGPTTADYLTNEEHVSVAGVASTPSPDGLADAIAAALH